VKDLPDIRAHASEWANVATGGGGGSTTKVRKKGRKKNEHLQTSGSNKNLGEENRAVLSGPQSQPPRETRASLLVGSPIDLRSERRKSRGAKSGSAGAS